MILLKKWEDLPPQMRCENVRRYYDILHKKRISLIVKRLFDIVASLVLLILLLPFFPLFAIAIKLDSRGSVFFRQERVTQYGRHFRIFKFRTMSMAADRRGIQLTLSDDARVTRVGSVIRHGRIDEIPQLIDILFGRMSFVGTRPEVPRYVEHYTPEMMATLLLPAGVTSETSIIFRDEAVNLSAGQDPEEAYVNDLLIRKMKGNLYELEHFSLINDLRTIFRTVGAMLGMDVDKTSHITAARDGRIPETTTIA